VAAWIVAGEKPDGAAAAIPGMAAAAMNIVAATDKNVRFIEISLMVIPVDNMFRIRGNYVSKVRPGRAFAGASIKPV
jgi:hypothetical protein